MILDFRFWIIAVFLLLPDFALAQSAGELERMEKQVQEQSMEHKKLQAQAMQINLELTEVSSEMIGVARQIQSNEERMSAMEVELAILQKELKEAEEHFAAEDENLIRTLAALQSLALKPTESLFVQPLTPVEIIRSAMLLREAVPYLEQNANKLRIELEKIEKKKQQVENQVQKIALQKNSLEKEHDQMKLLVQKKSRIRNAVEVQSVKTKKNIESLAGQAKDLRDLLGRLEKERIAKQKEMEEKRQAELKAREEQMAADAQKVEQSQRDSLIKFKPETIKDNGKAFAAAKGALLKPAVGPIAAYFGEETTKGVKTKGVSIKTRGLAQVVAPFDGTVIFAGPFRGYGNLIIIEHGDGYLSLLAGLENIDCELGQMLLAGEPLGLMPDEKDSRLYVEIRKDSHPVDPLNWIAM